MSVRVLLRPFLALLLLVPVGLALTVQPASAAPTAGSGSGPAGLTAVQEAVVLDLIDDICGDTWCEGDFAYQFRRFTCDAAAGTCTLRLRLARQTDGPLHWHSRSGVVRASRFEEMVETSATGEHSLREPFFLAVGEVVAEIEAGVSSSRCEQVRRLADLGVLALPVVRQAVCR